MRDFNIDKPLFRFGIDRTGVLDTMSSNRSWCRSHRTAQHRPVPTVAGRCGRCRRSNRSGGGRRRWRRRSPWRQGKQRVWVCSGAGKSPRVNVIVLPGLVQKTGRSQLNRPFSPDRRSKPGLFAITIWQIEASPVRIEGGGPVGPSTFPTIIGT